MQSVATTSSICKSRPVERRWNLLFLLNRASRQGGRRPKATTSIRYFRISLDGDFCFGQKNWYFKSTISIFDIVVHTIVIKEVNLPWHTSHVQMKTYSVRFFLKASVLFRKTIAVLTFMCYLSEKTKGKRPRRLLYTKPFGRKTSHIKFCWSKPTYSLLSNAEKYFFKTSLPACT